MNLWQLIKRLFWDERRIQRLEQTMSATTDEIAEIKSNVLTYQSNVNTKIADLEAKLAAQNDPAVQLALDDLKATAAALVIPA